MTEQPSGVAVATLSEWAQDTLDLLAGDETRVSFFPLRADRAGSVGLWAWHAASEIGVHRLDVEDAWAIITP